MVYKFHAMKKNRQAGKNFLPQFASEEQDMTKLTKDEQKDKKMKDINPERIHRIGSFPSLVKFLREELDWRLDAEDVEDLTFEYEPDELGIDPKLAVKINQATAAFCRTSALGHFLSQF